MDMHEKLRQQLIHYVEQPEPSDEGHWYVVELSDLKREWDQIEFHFNDETDKLDMVRLIREEKE